MQRRVALWLMCVLVLIPTVASAIVCANRPPIADAGPNQSALVNTSVSFDAGCSVDPGGAISTYAWTFGDGGTATGATPSHTYTAAGSYTVTLTVTDTVGATGTDTLIVTVTAAATGAYVWSRGFGALNDDRGSAIAMDGTNNVLVTGYYKGTVDFGDGPLTSASQDFFLAKYSPTGAPLWAKSVGGIADEAGTGVAADSDGNVVITGWRSSYQVDFGGGVQYGVSYSDIFLAKYSPAGGYLWAKTIGGAGYDAATGVAVDSTGNVVITGRLYVSTFGVNFGGGPLYSAGTSDVFVAKYSPAGTHLWSKRFGSTGSDSGTAVAVDSNGNVIITGLFHGTVNFGGTALTSAGANDIFVAKYDSDGNHLWSRRYGTTTDDYSYALAVDGSGNVILTGVFAGTVNFGGGPLTSAGGYDIFVASYDPDGAHRWSQRFGSTSNDYGYGVAADAIGNVAVTGYFAGTVNFGGTALTSIGNDVFVANYSLNGNPLWAKRFGGVGTQVGSAVASAGAIAVTGFFANTVDFGGGTFTSAGGYDIFVLGLTP